MKNAYVLTITLLLVICMACGGAAPAATSTPQPSNTPEPSLTPTREVHLLGGDVPTPDPDAWVYVVLGDSEAWGVGEYYADYIAEDNGVEVQLYDAWRGALSTKGLLTMLEIDDTLRAFLAEAEVITFEANPMEYFDWYCFDKSGEFSNSEESWARYKADLNAVVDMLFALREGQPTLIIAQNQYVPIYDYEKSLGIFDECLPWWEAVNEVIAEVAAERGLLLADVFSAFNGADHLEDPCDKGYISGDGMHTNEAGRIAIADVFRALGYEMIVP